MDRPSHGKGMVPCRSVCPTCGDECSRLHRATAAVHNHQDMARHLWVEAVA